MIGRVWLTEGKNGKGYKWLEALGTGFRLRISTLLGFQPIPVHANLECSWAEGFCGIGLTAVHFLHFIFATNVIAAAKCDQCQDSTMILWRGMHTYRLEA